MVKGVTKKEFVVYSGESFTIEWYFSENGKSDALDFYESLSNSQRIKLLKLVKRIGDAGKIFDKTKFNYEEDDIWAFKPQPDRFLCFFIKGKKIIITNGFRKKQQKLPKSEKRKALERKNDYQERVKKETYYD